MQTAHTPGDLQLCVRLVGDTYEYENETMPPDDAVIPVSTRVQLPRELTVGRDACTAPPTQSMASVITHDPPTRRRRLIEMTPAALNQRYLLRVANFPRRSYYVLPRSMPQDAMKVRWVSQSLLTRVDGVLNRLLLRHHSLPALGRQPRSRRHSPRSHLAASLQVIFLVWYFAVTYPRPPPPYASPPTPPE